jgi:hypothetical protein
MFEHKLLYGSRGRASSRGPSTPPKRHPRRGLHGAPEPRRGQRRDLVSPCSWSIHFAGGRAARGRRIGRRGASMQLAPIDYETPGSRCGRRGESSSRGRAEDRGWVPSSPRDHRAVRRKSPDPGRPSRVGRRASPVQPGTENAYRPDAARIIRRRAKSSDDGRSPIRTELTGSNPLSEEMRHGGSRIETRPLI